MAQVIFSFINYVYVFPDCKHKVRANVYILSCQSSFKNASFHFYSIKETLLQELETKQQKSVHALRENQLTTQHRTELGNQVGHSYQYYIFYFN